jgi:hypothetical protein
MRSSGRFPIVAARRWFRAAVMVVVVCVWTAVAFVLVLTIMLVPGLALTVPAPLAALMLGCLGGLLITQHPGSTTRQVLVAGSSVGVGALLANMLAFGLIGYVLASLPAIQDMLQTAVFQIGTAGSPGLMAPLGAAAGGFAGFVSGVVDLILAVVGALVGGLLAEHLPAQKRVRLVHSSATHSTAVTSGRPMVRGRMLPVAPHSRRADSPAGSPRGFRPTASTGAKQGDGG